MMQTSVFLVLAVLLVVLMVVLFRHFFTWMRAFAGGAPVPMIELLAMWVRRSPVRLIVDCRITAAQAGLDLTVDQLEAHCLAGGKIDDVVLAMIAASQRECFLSFDRACAIDLAFMGTENNVLEAARSNRLPDLTEFP